jgi:hypothetical protein
MFDPVGGRFQNVASASQLGFNQANQGFGSLQGNIGTALQPFQFQRNMQFQANQAGGGGFGSLLGGMGAIGLGAFSGGLGTAAAAGLPGAIKKLWVK